ncbi:MAG: redoxin domain-containing protein [Planctomycetes bacterium]|nr:redoxin domain-containing protein [Planctomycetota bacterium]
MNVLLISRFATLLFWALAGQPAPNEGDAPAAWSSFLEKFDASHLPKIDHPNATKEEGDALQKRQTQWHHERLAALQEFVERFPKCREASRARIEWAREVRPYEEKAAQRLLGDVIDAAADPACVCEARYLLGMTYFRNNTKKAAALFEEAAASPGEPEWRANALAALGDLLSKAGKPNEARERYERVAAEFKGTRAAARAERELKRLGAEEPGALSPGRSFPDFETTTLAGAAVSTARLRGSVVLVDFFTTDDPAWNADFAALRSLYAQVHTRGFEILGVALDSERATVEAFRDAESVTWPLHWDDAKADVRVARTLGVTARSACFVVDRRGRIRFRDVRGKALLAAIESLVAESP